MSETITLDQLRAWISAEYADVEQLQAAARRAQRWLTSDLYGARMSALIELAGRIEAETGKIIFLPDEEPAPAPAPNGGDIIARLRREVLGEK